MTVKNQEIQIFVMVFIVQQKKNFGINVEVDIVMQKQIHARTSHPLLQALIPLVLSLPVLTLINQIQIIQIYLSGGC